MRAAYQDYLARDRHPAVVLYLEVPPEMVDVNVHPAKSEVRFRDNGMIRGLIIGTLRHALNEAGHRAASTVSHAALGAARPVFSGGHGYAPSRYAPAPQQMIPEIAHMLAEPLGQPYQSAPAFGLWGQDAPAPAVRNVAESESVVEMPAFVAPVEDYPLGAACAQVHETYIIAQTRDGIVIVDQHAAHERLVYERMKQAMSEASGVARQVLLIPEVISLDELSAQRLLKRHDALAVLGLVLEGFGEGTIVVREIPAMAGNIDVAGLVQDLADEIAEYGEALSLSEKIAEICGNRACRNSVRAGRRLSIEEMNALLRQMEATPHSGQCNHGRPTYVELKLPDIERLFGRR